VMNAWGKAHGSDDVVMLGDGSAEFSEACGLSVDRISAGMGSRSQRYSMLVDDGVVKQLNVEPSGEYGVSSGEAMLAKL
jgi:peroxiredoxin